MKCKNEDITIHEQDSFGDFLRKKRLSMGLNQDDFGYFLGGLRQTTICSWESGRTSPSIEDAKRYMEILGAELKIVNIKDFQKILSSEPASSKDRLSEIEELYAKEAEVI